MEKNNNKAWLYLLPALIFIAIFFVYPLIDIFIYSFREDYNLIQDSSTGVGFGNYLKVLNDTGFVQAMKNTLILVFITVPLSTVLALLISMGLSSIKFLRNAFQTIYFLPYVTNTLAVGMVFIILFSGEERGGLFASLISAFGGDQVDFINGDYWSKMLVLSLYTIWTVLPFKVLILTGALASVKDDYYNVARLDGTSSFRIFRKITIPMISPSLFYLIITGFIGAFKAYSDAVALFTREKIGEMNTVVGYIYDSLTERGGYISYASAAAIILFVVVLTVTYINLLVSKRNVHY